MSSSDGGNEPGTAPIAVLGMLTAMRSVGVDVDAVCAAVGLSEAGLVKRTAFLPISEVMPLWRTAMKQFPNGTLGLRVGVAMPAGTLLDYLASSSANLRAGLGQIARYLALDTGAVKWVAGPRDADGLTTFEQQLTFAPEAVPLQLREFGIAMAVSRLHMWFERRPREVWFTHAPLGPVDEYRQVLGCPVHFERPLVGVRYDDEALETPARSHDPNLFRLLESHAERVLAEIPATATFRERVRGAVIERLRDGEPDIASVATVLGTSERSLQRKLQDEGGSFRDVVDEARHKLALLYLGDESLSMTDVACLLGYSEAPAFTRAFKRWTGRAPSQARG